MNEITTLHEARLHLRVADAIESRPDLSDSDIEILAEHLYAARSLGVGYRAAVALRQAAAVAIRRSAYTAAEDLLSRAALLLRTRRGRPRSPQRRARRARGAVLRPARHARARRGDGQRTDRRARELAAGHRARRRRGAPAVGGVGGRRQGRATRSARESWPTSSPPRRRRPATRMIEGLSLHARGVICWHAGDLAGSVAALDRAAALNLQWASTSQTSVLSMIWPVSPVAWPRGHPVVAFVHMLVGDHDDPMAEFERIADRRPAAVRQHGRVDVRRPSGRWRSTTSTLAVAAGRRGLEADPDLVFTYWGPGAHMALGAALAAKASSTKDSASSPAPCRGTWPAGPASSCRWCTPGWRRAWPAAAGSTRPRPS